MLFVFRTKYSIFHSSHLIPERIPKMGSAVLAATGTKNLNAIVDNDPEWESSEVQKRPSRTL